MDDKNATVTVEYKSGDTAMKAIIPMTSEEAYQIFVAAEGVPSAAVSSDGAQRVPPVSQAS